MSDFESAIATANIVLAVAAVVSAMYAVRSAKGNAEALGVARAAAEAASKSADSMGKAVEQFKAQVKVSEEHLAFERSRQQPQVSAQIDLKYQKKGAPHARRRIGVTVRSADGRAYVVRGLGFEREGGFDPVELEQLHPTSIPGDGSNRPLEAGLSNLAPLVRGMSDLTGGVSVLFSPEFAVPVPMNPSDQEQVKAFLAEAAAG